MVNITIDKSGAIEPVKLFKAIEDGVRKRLPKHAASAFKQSIVNNINTNRFGFSLSEAWKQTKRLKGWDLEPFKAEGYYIDAIDIITTDGHLSVGFRRGSVHPRAKMSMGKLARILEYGVPDRNLPARPLWHRTSDEFFKDFPAIIKKVIKEEIIANG